MDLSLWIILFMFVLEIGHKCKNYEYEVPM